MIFNKLSISNTIIENRMITKTSKTTSARVRTGLASILLILISFPNVGWGQYTLVTSETSLNAGDIFILVGKNGSNFFASSSQSLVNSNRDGVSVSAPVSNTITTITASELTLEGSAGAWYLKDISASQYLVPVGGASNGLKLQSTTTNAKWKFTIDAGTGAANPVCENTSTYPRNKLRYNTAANVFSCYSVGQTDVYIYKKTLPTCTAPTLQSTAATSSIITNNSMHLSWTSGNGTAGRIVVMKEASAVNGNPTSGTNYTANATFGSGGTIATNEFVVYNGTGNSVSVTGLACGKTYYLKVYEYNTTDVCYNTTSPAAANATTTKPATPNAPIFLVG